MQMQNEQCFVCEIAGERLDVFLASAAEVTRSAAQKWIADGLVTVGSQVATKNQRLKQGDCVLVDLPEPELLDVVPQDIPLDIVYEDDDLLVVNKPKGMVVHPAPGHKDGTLVNALLFHCGKNLAAINGIIRPGIVHRIDRDTSGLLVVAKNDNAHVSLSSQISAHTFERKYASIVIGTPKSEKGTVDAPIGRHPTDRKKMAILAGGRNAVTHYEVKEQLRGYSRIELQLETGRTHQIRVHMASLGHPVLGDPVYGGDRTPFARAQASRLCGQCLHAQTISFRHPRTGELMHFASELPAYFEKVLSILRQET